MNKAVYTKNLRALEFIIVDALIAIFVLWFSLYFANNINLFLHNDVLYILLITVFLKTVIYSLFHLYHLVLEFVGFSEGIRSFFAVCISQALLYIIYRVFFPGLLPFVLLMFIIPVEFLMIFFARLSKRVLIRIGFIYGGTNNIYKKNNIHTLVIGAGSGGKLVLDEISKNASLRNRVLAFVDDDPIKINKRLNGIPVFGPISDALSLVDKYKVTEIIIAIANLKPERLKAIIELFSQRTLRIRRLPLMTEISTDTKRRIIDVNIEDLLSRGVVELDSQGLLDFIKGKTVLVTGGGGSIGSELCHQILSYHPQTLVVFDIYENTTYDVQIELRRRIDEERLDTHLVVLIGSVYNDTRMESVFETYKPQLVFHAAAYKHVPLMEDSAVEAVRTNVLGTYNVARLSDRYGVEKMVLVSTDKAVRPTNVMGATKSCCEKIIQYFASISKTNYSAVRFGNVLGSNGSVVPLFKKQIAEGGPITITDRKITRYFMTISEAVSLILQSGVYATGGEIFILDMGEPVHIYDLAENMIRLSGLTPGVDIKIVEIGLRPGEKLYEELLIDKDKHIKTQNDKIFIETNGKPINVEDFIAKMKQQFEVISNQEVKQMVQNVVESYIIDDKTDN